MPSVPPISQHHTAVLLAWQVRDYVHTKNYAEALRSMQALRRTLEQTLGIERKRRVREEITFEEDD